MILQLILYDQLNKQYCYDDASHYLFLLCTKNIISPYGVLNLNSFSKDIEYNASKHFIGELKKTGKKAERIESESYFTGLLGYCKVNNIFQIVIMDPSEPMILDIFIKIQNKLQKHDIKLDFRKNKQFLISHEDFAKKFPKPPVMELFYRRMRKEKNILMQDDQPIEGRRNFDKENRKFDSKYKASGKKIGYPISREQALLLLEDFIENKLNRFGELEDAMYSEDIYVHHSLLSTSINFGLLTPMEVIKAIESASTSINNKEGFIRQVLGWREYMYHWFYFYKNTIYNQNALNHTKKLPERFRWPENSPLSMNCVNRVLQIVKNTGYSNHITRLMIIGNFCLLIGYNPHHVNKRFREMYADAFQRVVTPNVLAMSQFADGGNLATKPYVSSANYINNMSDYCKTCKYDPKQKSGPNACPMNYLYRNFVDIHKDLFKRQPFIVKNLEKVDIFQIRKDAATFIELIS